jgi:pectinesterase
MFVPGDDVATPLVGGERAAPAPTGTRKSSAAIVGVAVVALLVLATVISNPVEVRLRSSKRGKNVENNLQMVGLQAITAACRATLYPQTCRETLTDKHYAHSADSLGLTRVLLFSASQGVKNTLASVVAGNGAEKSLSIVGGGALEVCEHNLVRSLEQLEAADADLTAFSKFSSDVERDLWRSTSFDDIKTKVSAAMEFHTTCIDTLVETGTLESKTIQAKEETEELLSNAIAFVNALFSFGNDLQLWTRPMHSERPNSWDFPRRLLNPEETQAVLNSEDDAAAASVLPSWMSSEQKEHLLDAAAAPTPNVVVAKDGSGKFNTIQAAVNAAPQTGSDTANRYVIYIKTGVYDEQVTIPKKATNIMFTGDGAGKTVITGHLSVDGTPGTTTFMSATLIIEGSGFIGKFFTAQNTAGPTGHQAVAVRVSADKAVFYQCSLDSYQDSLYAHTFRHFFRETTILGTVDFIFGNGNSVFQSCNVIAKKPLLGQQNTYTAQGKTDPGQNTGLSFQSCTFDATADLKSNAAQFPTYLGRPWKAYSTCVNLKCNLLGHVNPAGWLPWNTSDFGLKTSFFAEYLSFGAGANTAKRVSWSHQITDRNQALTYQALSFITANSWVPATGVPLTTTL